MDFDKLLTRYRSIWNNRLLEGMEGSEAILKEAIKRELLDENSHPRVRKGKYEKYYLASKRILNSSIGVEEKVALIRMHDEIMDEL